MFNFLKKWFPSYQRPENTGVLLGNQPTDFFAGVNSPIIYQERLISGDWLPYALDMRNQYCFYKGQYVDFLSCVSCSLLSAIEAQELFLTGKQVTYSRRWLAKVSGTTKQGNYLYKVADVVRNIGLVLESSYPDIVGTWDDYYSEPKSELYQEAAQWRTKWNFDYEFLTVTDTNLDYHLKHSPIQVVIPGHAICGIYSPNDYMQYRDSYSPYDKSEKVSYLQSAMKGILTPKTILARKVGWLGSAELGVYIPADSMERFELIKQNIGSWLPGYSLDEKTYTLGKKPF
jgi:hypothetical protein